MRAFLSANKNPAEAGFLQVMRNAFYVCLLTPATDGSKAEQA